MFSDHYLCVSEGASQFGFLELSQSQDLRGEVVNRQVEDDRERRNTSAAEQSISSRTSQSQDNKAARSEVSSSWSESSGQSGRQRGIEALLHSEVLQASDEQEIPSSQEDMFDPEKTGGAVDSTVSEPEQQGHPTATPAQTLRLLHLSGQGTLVQETLSQSSVDFVAATQDNFSQNLLIVPSSPTEAENKHGKRLNLL
ncbi:tumor suppressor p53-binding protein 1-like [Notothenia coriiceps]|uniref:Tumor suppressor p53-binding protein 1-like n=1 Tax=Notothenia coriiceps TaxID=8208 RepID=A0A6I9PC98_9TELE|nr:PREDICTED: tumor suppressor p53-binding protein 1-like [Notothenia coriiceps]